MNSDEDKIYTKIVSFDEIYNFVVQTFFIWSHLVKKTIYYPDLNFSASRWVDDFKWKKFEL
jgi:hypothetical protein